MYQLKKSYSLTDLANLDEADFDKSRAIGFAAGQGSESIVSGSIHCVIGVGLSSIANALTRNDLSDWNG